jgi:hypothetical protein
MKKLFRYITILAVIFVTMFGMSENVRSLENNSLTSAASAAIPVKQVVVYSAQAVSYANFNAAIFALGQLKYVSQLPAGSAVSLYVDTNKVNGPVGLQAGTRCSATQAKASYYQNTITMDQRFCLDFNDAILNKRVVYGIIPTEAVFLHKANGQRCSASGNGGAFYLTNPASAFYRNYLVKRGSGKLAQLKMNTLFLDDLRVGWSEITSICGGNPKEYSSISGYFGQMVGLVRYVHDNLPAYKIEGNLANASPEWDRFAFLDGAMCENCFTNWGGSWPTPSKMLSDLSIMDKWVKGGRKLYTISLAPDTSVVSNRFTFAASLLVANSDKVYFHFGSNYGQFYSIPEYTYNLGLPLAAYVCNGNICVRNFQRGRVVVNFGTQKGAVILNSASVMEVTPTATVTADLIAASPTDTLTSIPTDTLIEPSMTPTVVPTIIETEPTQTFQSPEPTETIEATATEVFIPTDTPTPTMIPPTSATEVVVFPSETPMPVEP